MWVVFKRAGCCVSVFLAMSTVPVSRNFFRSLLTSCFVHLFSGNSSVNLFAVYLSKYESFIKILSSLLNTTLIVDKHCSDVCGDEFLVPQIDRKSKLEIRSVEHGICPVAEFTSPLLSCAAILAIRP